MVLPAFTLSTKLGAGWSGRLRNQYGFLPARGRSAAVVTFRLSTRGVARRPLSTGTRRSGV